MPLWLLIRDIFRSYFRTVAFSTVLLLLFLYPGSSIPAVRIANLDKAIHLIAFSLLYVIAYAEWSFHRSSSSQSRWSIAIVVISLLFGLSVEVLQGVLPLNRSMELADFVADSLGVMLGILICAAVGKHFIHRIFRMS
ncbi:MAG: VanZ family protein [Flavobacteriales bacterium]|nr:VanZ family protein [Flavobacteriales bacterium]